MSKSDTGVNHNKGIRKDGLIMITRTIPIDLGKARAAFNEMKDRLTKQEQDLINALFEIENRTSKSKEEFEKTYKLDNEQMKSVLRDVLIKCDKEMKEIQYATHLHISDNIWIKPGDIVEIEMRVSEDPIETKSDLTVWHEITYKLNDKVLHDFSFDLPEDQKYEDISEYIDASIMTDLEVTDYEVFEESGDGFLETAKIKVKSLKEL